MTPEECDIEAKEEDEYYVELDVALGVLEETEPKEIAFKEPTADESGDAVDAFLNECIGKKNDESVEERVLIEEMEGETEQDKNNDRPKPYTRQTRSASKKSKSSESSK